MLECVLIELADTYITPLALAAAQVPLVLAFKRRYIRNRAFSYMYEYSGMN